MISMDDATVLGGALNQLGQTVKKTVRQAAKIPEEMAVDARGQFGGVKSGNEDIEKKPKKQWQSNEKRVSFLKSLYGSNDKKPSEFQEKIADKPIEEQKKITQLRGQLHQENYYNPTFNPVRNPPAGGEERPAEKVEQEKKKEMRDLQEKEAKAPPPLAVVRERNKAEMFRGATG